MDDNETGQDLYFWEPKSATHLNHAFGPRVAVLHREYFFVWIHTSENKPPWAGCRVKRYFTRLSQGTISQIYNKPGVSPSTPLCLQTQSQEQQ